MIARTGKKELKQGKISRSAKLVPGIGDVSRLKVWVVYPHLVTDDPNLQYYYDFTQSLKEYTDVFHKLGVEWKWQPVTVSDYDEVIAGIRKASGRKVPIVLNLCDGDEVNGTPGVSVVHSLEKHRLIYTGSDASFYNITTSKFPMKRAFDNAGVATPAWSEVNKDTIPGLVKRLGAPLILKPAVSGGSMGVSVKNVVYTQEELEQRVAEMEAGYRGWNLLADGLMAEAFVNGPEYTTLVVGTGKERTVVYPAVERVFHESLPEEEKFLSFDRLWEIYEEEKPMPSDGNFYEYAVPEKRYHREIERLSLEAYHSVNAVGYGRLDIRMDKSTGKMYVLEINAQCGLSEDENYTSIGAILRVAGKSFSSLIAEILADAMQRRGLTLRNT